jgi:hypothetical protein
MNAGRTGCRGCISKGACLLGASHNLCAFQAGCMFYCLCFSLNKEVFRRLIGSQEKGHHYGCVNSPNCLYHVCVDVYSKIRTYVCSKELTRNCISCCVNLIEWMKGKTSMPFAVPIAWCEPNTHFEDWEEFFSGNSCVTYTPLVCCQLLLIPQLHIKLGLMKDSVKIVDNNSDGLNYLKHNFPKSSD